MANIYILTKTIDCCTSFAKGIDFANDSSLITREVEPLNINGINRCYRLRVEDTDTEDCTYVLLGPDLYPLQIKTAGDHSLVRRSDSGYWIGIDSKGESIFSTPVDEMAPNTVDSDLISSRAKPRTSSAGM